MSGDLPELTYTFIHPQGQNFLHHCPVPTVSIPWSSLEEAGLRGGGSICHFNSTGPGASDNLNVWHSVHVHEYTSIDSEVTNFNELGRFADTEFTNNEDQLYPV